nr:putative integron gene cassette protein [uncultured bacterium]
MNEKIGVNALKSVNVLYEGDIYDLACLLLKVSKAKDKGTNSRSRHTVHGLATAYSLITHLQREEILATFENYDLSLGAVVEYDQDIP